MGARTGQEYVEGLRDGRSVYVNGELVRDVTSYPPFRGVIRTLADMYDRQHHPAYKDLLTYPSPSQKSTIDFTALSAGTSIGARQTTRRLGRREQISESAD